MKEMNQSLLNSGGGVGAQAAILQNNASMVSSMLGKKSKKMPVGGGQMANMNESIRYMRQAAGGLSNPSSRPRSQLGAT